MEGSVGCTDYGMARSSTGRVLLVVCLLFLATSTVAAIPIAPASPDRATHLSHPVENFGDPLDDATNTTNDTFDDTTDTVTDTTDTIDDTVDDTTDATTDSVTDATSTTTATTTTSTTTTNSDTTTTATTTTSSTTTVDDTISTTADATTSTVSGTFETVESSTESVQNTTDSVTETVNSTTESVEGTAGETVDDTVEQTADAGTSLTNETGAALESSASVDTVVGDTSLQTAVDGDGLLDATADTVQSTSDTVDSVTDSLDETTDSLGETTESVVDTTDSLDETTRSVGDSISTVVESTEDTVHVASDGVGEESLHAASTGSESGTSTSDGSGDSTPGESADVDSETAVNVEDTGDGSDEDQTVGLLASAYRGLGGTIPESVPDGAMGGVVGLGGLALAAVVSRQLVTQTAGTGSTSLLTAGFGGSLDGWLEKLKRFVVPLRYSRYDNSDPLEHDARRALYEVVESSPGVYLTDLAEQADVPVSTARHHVRVLSDERLVRTEKRHGKRRYYPVTATNTELTDALSEPAKAAVLHSLAEHGEAPVGQLADELDRDPSTVTHHLQALESDGLVVRERRGRTVVNRLCEDVESILTSTDAPSRPGGKPNAPADD